MSSALVGVALVAGGCGGSSAPHASSKAAHEAPAWGEPAYSSTTAVTAAVKDYSERNNPLVEKSNRPPFPRNVYGPVDIGVTLLGDPYEVALVQVDPKQRAGNRPFQYLTPTTVYMPASTTWPKSVYVVANTYVKGRKVPKPGRWIQLTLFEQKAKGGPLFNAATVWVLREKLPKALPLGSDTRVPTDVRMRARALANALGRHWVRRSTKVAGFSKINYLDATLRGWVQGQYERLTWSPRLMAGDLGLRTVAVTGGTLVMANYRVTTHVEAVGPGSTVFWTGNLAKVFGGQQRTSMALRSVATAVWFMPAGGGPAQQLGSEDRPLLK